MSTPPGYDLPAVKTGQYASRLEAEWAAALRTWGLEAEYCGDRVPHFDFVIALGGQPLPLEVKPFLDSTDPRADLVDRAIRRFHWHSRSQRVYQFGTKGGRVAGDKLLVVQGRPERARWWFALQFAPSAWHAIPVAGPVRVLGCLSSAVKWPVRGGEVVPVVHRQAGPPAQRHPPPRRHLACRRV